MVALNYRNHRINIIPQEDASNRIVICFGSTKIYDETVKESPTGAIALAKQFINEFCSMLPPALSYKPFNDADK